MTPDRLLHFYDVFERPANTTQKNDVINVKFQGSDYGLSLLCSVIFLTIIVFTSIRFFTYFFFTLTIYFLV
jgi:hypothetical protein